MQLTQLVAIIFGIVVTVVVIIIITIIIIINIGLVFNMGCHSPIVRLSLTLYW